MAKVEELTVFEGMDRLLNPIDEQIKKVDTEIYKPPPELTTMPTKEELEWFDIVGNGSIKKKIVKKGNGVRVHDNNNLCVVNIKGYLPDTTLVEEYNQHEIIIGDCEVVRGLDIAISLMEEGESALIEIKPRFAYGDNGSKDPCKIPPKATILYKVDVVSAKPEPIPEELTLLERLKIGSKKRERGNWWYQRNDITTAVVLYRKALEFLDMPEKLVEETNPESSHMKQFMEDRQKVLTNLATAQYYLKAYDAALLAIDGVLQFDPRNVKALYRKGKILTDQKLHSEALNVFKDALQIEPDNVLLKQEINRVQDLNRKDQQQVADLYKKMIGGKESAKKTSKKPSNNKSGRPMAAMLVGSVAAVAVAFVAYRYSTQFHD